jgi:glutaminyl-tRNA synthetase
VCVFFAEDRVFSGFSITAEELYHRISEFVASSSFVGWDSLNAAISGAKGLRELRWASPVELKTTVEKVFTDKFGAKEAAKPKSKVNLSFPAFESSGSRYPACAC